MLIVEIPLVDFIYFNCLVWSDDYFRNGENSFLFIKIHECFLFNIVMVRIINVENRYKY